MLELKNVSKIYKTGEFVNRALDEVSISFRQKEFVAILGQSGSGKTTLLNMIGGLDRYDEGDLIINGNSTSGFKDRDWDAYRCHRVGFVFQSYNLIAHQSVLSNVELALTIAGVSASERKKRALKVLDEVGLADHVHKRPNQLSGGQMQRVAIARALINDPEILLADEPTGALDSDTGIQVMEILQEVAKERLVIMVTHNITLADEFASRIVELRDGVIISDSNPYLEEGSNSATSMNQRSGMSFLTSLGLSLANLRTKKGRTILTSLAGSIGIIGIALILSISGGVNRYVDDLQRETMTSYPVVIQNRAFDFGGAMKAGRDDAEKEREEGIHKVDDQLLVPSFRNLKAEDRMSQAIQTNDLEKFKAYLDDVETGLAKNIPEASVVYSYSVPFRVFTRDSEGRIIANDDSPYKLLGAGDSEANYFEDDENIGMVGMQTAGVSNFQELIPGTGGELISPVIIDNFELLEGEWPKTENEVVLRLSSQNTISAEQLFQLGIITMEEYLGYGEAIRNNETPSEVAWDLASLIGREYHLVPAFNTFKLQDGGVFQQMESDLESREILLNKAWVLKVSGVVRPKTNMLSAPLSNPIGYTSLLTEKLLAEAEKSPIVQLQQKNPEINVLTGKKFETNESVFPFGTSGENSFLDAITNKPSAEQNLKLFGYANKDIPDNISIYVDSFEAKDALNAYIEEYNNSPDTERKIVYTDFIAMITSSMTTVVNAVSYVLIAFIAISLIVSGLMIGVITHISVLERTREIGILRALGASKKNVSRVFNAETVIIGFFSGLLGVVVSLLLSVPINSLASQAIGDPRIKTFLNPITAVSLIVLSIVITYIGGAIPSRKAAKLNPVDALRSE